MSCSGHISGDGAIYLQRMEPFVQGEENREKTECESPKAVFASQVEQEIQDLSDERQFPIRRGQR